MNDISEGCTALPDKILKGYKKSHRKVRRKVLVFCMTKMAETAAEYAVYG